MEVTKVELKILIKEFLTASNRVLRAGYEIYADELEKFIKFLKAKKLIYDYIMSCGEPEYDAEQAVRDLRNSYGKSTFVLGSTDEKEVANIFSVIQYLAEKNMVDVVMCIMDIQIRISFKIKSMHLGTNL